MHLSFCLSLYLRMHFFGKPFQVTAATWNKTGLLVRTQLDLVFAHCLNGVQPNILIHSANASRLADTLAASTRPSSSWAKSICYLLSTSNLHFSGFQTMIIGYSCCRTSASICTDEWQNNSVKPHSLIEKDFRPCRWTSCCQLLSHLRPCTPGSSSRSKPRDDLAKDCNCRNCRFHHCMTCLGVVNRAQISWRLAGSKQCWGHVSCSVKDGLRWTRCMIWIYLDCIGSFGLLIILDLQIQSWPRSFAHHMTAEDSPQCRSQKLVANSKQLEIIFATSIVFSTVSSAGHSAQWIGSRGRRQAEASW